jgi:predicted nucleic acid-binding Zn ribbon protein
MKIEEVLGELLGETALGERVAEAEVVAEWNERVGEAIAAVTIPMRVSRGTLVVGVRSSAWLMELQMMERQILRQLNRGRTSGRISRIRFVMAGA